MATRAERDAVRTWVVRTEGPDLTKYCRVEAENAMLDRGDLKFVNRAGGTVAGYAKGTWRWFREFKAETDTGKV